MTETQQEIVKRIFKPYNKRYRGRNDLYMNIWAYRGKHYLEKHGSEYISKKEFEELLQRMNIYPIKKTLNTYPLQIRKEYYIYGL